MALQEYDFQCEQNTDFLVNAIFQYPDPSGYGQISNGPYYNFAGYTAKMTICEANNPSSQIILALSTPATPVQGLTMIVGTGASGTHAPSAPNWNGVSILITAQITQNLPIGAWYYDLILYSGDPTPLQVAALKGIFRVNAIVTR